MIGKLIFWIFITLISLAFLIYYVARDVPDIVKEGQELDKAKQDVKQSQKEVQKAYDECVKVSDKSRCDAIVANNPNVITQSSSSQDNPSNANTNNAENYDDLNDLVHDIKSNVVNNDDISLNTFKDSGAYQGADANTQDCIDLAAKIGHNLKDTEIVHCSEDPNFYQNQISNRDNKK